MNVYVSNRIFRRKILFPLPNHEKVTKHICQRAVQFLRVNGQEQVPSISMFLSSIII